SRYVCAPRIGSHVSHVRRLTCAAGGSGSGALKKTLISTPSAAATEFSEVSEIDERPRSTRERKLIEYPVTRPRSRSESPFSRRSRRIVAPIPASCAPASRWRLAGATGAVGARTAVTRAFYHTE